MNIGEATEIDKGFIDTILLHPRGILPDDLHHALRHVAIECVIGRAHHESTLLAMMLHLEIGFSHANAESFGFVAARNHTPIVVGKHHNGLVEQTRTKDALARHEEIIAIDDSYHANFSGIREKRTEEETTSLEV